MITLENKAAADRVTVEQDGLRTLIVATISAVGEVASDLGSRLERLSPAENPELTLDLRRCKAVDPVVIHALMHAWEQRDRRFGSVRVLVPAGPIARYVDVLGLGSALDIVHPATGAGFTILPMGDAEWEPIQEETVRHFNRLMDAARLRDLSALRQESQQAHAMCVAVGAHPSGEAFGPWCAHCPMRAEYGGCQPLIDHMLRAAAHDDWKTAQLLILTLISEAVEMKVDHHAGN